MGETILPKKDNSLAILASETKGGTFDTTIFLEGLLSGRTCVNASFNHDSRLNKLISFFDRV